MNKIEKAIRKKVKQLTGTSHIRTGRNRNGFYVRVTDGPFNAQKIVNEFGHCEYYPLENTFLFLNPEMEEVEVEVKA